jgi:hypothetical protein
MVKLSTSHVVSALRRRYGHLLGEIAQCPDKELDADLEAVGRVLLLFSPNDDLGAIRLIQPRSRRYGRWTRHALDCLRQANHPLTGRELARMVMDRHDIHWTNFRLLKSIECGLHAALGRLEGRGVRLVGVDPKRWELG